MLCESEKKGRKLSVIVTGPYTLSPSVLPLRSQTTVTAESQTVIPSSTASFIFLEVSVPCGGIFTQQGTENRQNRGEKKISAEHLSDDPQAK